MILETADAREAGQRGTRRVWLTTAAVGLVLLCAWVLFFQPRTLDHLSFPAESRPMTSEDEIPSWYKGTRPPELNLEETRLLGRVDGMPIFLSMDRVRTALCVAIIDDMEAIGGGCASQREVAKSGLWLSVVNGSGLEYTAVVMPVEYPTLEVPQGVTVLLRNSEVVVIRTPHEKSELVLRGPGLRSIVVPVQAFN